MRRVLPPLWESSTLWKGTGGGGAHAQALSRCRLAFRRGHGTTLWQMCALGVCVCACLGLQKHLEELAAPKEGSKVGEGGAGALAAAWGVQYAPLCALGPGSLVLAANRCRGLLALTAAEGALATGPARGAVGGELPSGSTPASRYDTSKHPLASSSAALQAE